MPQTAWPLGFFSMYVVCANSYLRKLLVSQIGGHSVILSGSQKEFESEALQDMTVRILSSFREKTDGREGSDLAKGGALPPSQHFPQVLMARVSSALQTTLNQRQIFLHHKKIIFSNTSMTKSASLFIYTNSTANCTIFFTLLHSCYEALSFSLQKAHDTRLNIKPTGLQRVTRFQFNWLMGSFRTFSIFAAYLKAYNSPRNICLISMLVLVYPIFVPFHATVPVSRHEIHYQPHALHLLC